MAKKAVRVGAAIMLGSALGGGAAGAAVGGLAGLLSGPQTYTSGPKGTVLTQTPQQEAEGRKLATEGAIFGGLGGASIGMFAGGMYNIRPRKRNSAFTEGHGNARR